MAKKTLSIFIAVLVLSLLLGCGGGEEATTPTPSAAAVGMSPSELVAQRANMIGYINVSQIIEDEDIAVVYEAMPLEPDMPQTLGEALDLVREESGLDLRDFGEVLMFGEISGTTVDMDYLGIVVRGTFEERDLIASIESGIDEEFTTVSYQGYEIYADSDQEDGLAFLGSDAFVIASVEAVEDVIAVREGDLSAVSGKLLDTYNGLGDGLMKVAMIVPPKAMEEGLQEFTSELAIPLPELDELADLDTVAMALAKEEQSIAFNGEMCFTSSGSAEDVEDLINSVIAMIVGMEVPEEGPGGIPIPVPIPEEGWQLLMELLNKLEVDTVDACLRIGLELTLAQIEDLLGEQGTQ